MSSDLSAPASTTTSAPATLTDDAVQLARRWLDATAADETPRERRTTGRLAALVGDPAGLELAVRFVDRVARPDDLHVAAAELAGLRTHAASARAFLGPVDRTLLALGVRLAPVLPAVVVPAARLRLRQLVGHLVADAGRGLGPHLAGMRAAGFRLNLNLLGEAVLGEGEAVARLARVRRLVERPDVDYVSVKVSAVASQLSTWDTAGSVDRVVQRLLPLYRVAAQNGTFLNLDMEEYRDLTLTMRVFERLVLDPELLTVPAGIVLQAYLPDASDALEELTATARRRRAAGGAPVKVRLVKGANLAMEQVEAELHGWPQAPYTTKADVDANYVRLLETALDPTRTDAVRVGVASHNLFHVAYAHLLAQHRGVGEALDVEMLQGMAPAQARAVREVVGDLLLYTPVVARDDFDVAISYLVRRLEENSAAQNFLHALFADEQAGTGEEGAASGVGMGAQEAAFRAAVHDAATVSTVPRRSARRPGPTSGPGTEQGDTSLAGRSSEPAALFANASDTDPAVAASRAWARGLLRGAPPVPDGAVQVTSTDEVDAVVARAVAAAPGWAATDPARRALALRRAALALERARGDLVATMVHEGAKTVAEADPEVSEAVDFARYYADRAAELADGTVPGAVFRPVRCHGRHPAVELPCGDPRGVDLGRAGRRVTRAGQTRTADAALRAGRDGRRAGGVRRGRGRSRRASGGAQPRG